MKCTEWLKQTKRLLTISGNFMKKCEMFKTRPNSQKTIKDEEYALINLKKLYALNIQNKNAKDKGGSYVH